MQHKVITNSFSETQQLGESFAQKLKGGEVIALHGDLGSGKTTFVQGLAKGLGIAQRIISPTFIIMRTYRVGEAFVTKGINHFYHVDLYRIENEQDISGLGLLELMNNPENVVVIEWPEKMENLLPDDRIDFIFRYLGDDQREIIKNSND